MGNYAAEQLLADNCEVAKLYTEILGAEFEWVDSETYVKNKYKTAEIPWILKHNSFFLQK